MTVIKIIVTLTLGLFLQTTNAQVLTTEKLLNVIAQSIKVDNSLTNMWTTCNKDSLFFKADTIQFYNSVNCRHEYECCHYVNWHFVDKFHFNQNKTYCEEPTGETINENLFSAEYVWKDNYNIMYIYRNAVLTNKFKVLSLDNVRLSNDQDNCYRITLIRLK